MSWLRPTGVERVISAVDKLFIRELRVETIIGFFDWERRVKQNVSIDLELATDARRAARTDSVRSTLNYDDLARRLTEFVGQSEFHLVESLAEAVAGIALREFGAPWVKVTIVKPGAVDGARDVGIVIERHAADA
jgi:dihydroneopterin aldolase